LHVNCIVFQFNLIVSNQIKWIQFKSSQVNFTHYVI
jgi:hypothetical protein